LGGCEAPCFRAPEAPCWAGCFPPVATPELPGDSHDTGAPVSFRTPKRPQTNLTLAVVVCMRGLTHVGVRQDTELKLKIERWKKGQGYLL
jgi:hypothetical protein